MNNNLKKIAIIGAGELGKQILNLISQSEILEFIGFFDDIIPVNTIVENYLVIGTTNEIENSFVNGTIDCLVVGIGYKHLDVRKQMFDRYEKRIPFETIIHRSCYVDPSAKIGRGTVLYPGCVIDKNVNIENNVLINLGVIISHDSKIASHSFISPGVTIAGFSSVGLCCNLGINTTIIDNLNITKYVTTGGGSVVIRDILESGLYVGNPVKRIH